MSRTALSRTAASRKARPTIALAALVAGLLSGTAPAGAAGVGQAQLVSAVPSAATPNIDDGVVYSIARIGSRVVAGGSFTQVSQPGRTVELTRTRLVAFDATTGTVDPRFAPVIDGAVETVVPGPTAATVYVGGEFKTVDGQPRRGLVELDLATGRPTAGFAVPALNGAVYGARLAGARLIITGGFTALGGVTRLGLAAVNPVTGALDPTLDVSLTGHHNYQGAGDAKGPVGGRDLDVSPDGRRLVVIGNFTRAGGHPHDQIVMIDLGRTAVLDPAWTTAGFTARCDYAAFDTYVRHVQFSPDGWYFVVVTTGGGAATTNTDGTRANCDTATRWPTAGRGTDLRPTWVARTGNDTLLSVAVTGTAVYVGGHQRWLNNDDGEDVAGPGAVPRPGLAALDPVSGVPLAWNPGRNPRGAGAYALLATSTGLYVGSDTDYIGNFRYRRARIAYFPLAGGRAVASSAVASMPADIYVPGLEGAAATTLIYRAVTGTRIGVAHTVPGTGVDWSATRGAFAVGSTIFYSTTDGQFRQVSIHDRAVGPPVTVDPYADPAWSGVPTGSGQTYAGVAPTFYAQLSTLTAAFYSAGRLYYARAGSPSLFWRSFSPDSGIVGETENSAAAGSLNFATVTGAFVAGSTIYYVIGGILESRSFRDGAVGSTSTVRSGPGVDWAGTGLFAVDTPKA